MCSFFCWLVYNVLILNTWLQEPSIGTDTQTEYYTLETSALQDDPPPPFSPTHPLSSNMYRSTPVCILALSIRYVHTFGKPLSSTCLRPLGWSDAATPRLGAQCDSNQVCCSKEAPPVTATGHSKVTAQTS